MAVVPERIAASMRMLNIYAEQVLCNSRESGNTPETKRKFPHFRTLSLSW
jgi:hypothetical protein